MARIQWYPNAATHGIGKPRQPVGARAAEQPVRGAATDIGLHSQTRVSEAEAKFLRDAAATYVPPGGIAIEIGSAFGYSARSIEQGMPLGAVLHCIDPWTLGADYRYANEDHEQRFDTWMDDVNRAATEQRVYKVKMRSKAYFDTLPERQERYISLAHIDGDHSTAGVLADWRYVRRYLLPGGIVIFHDYPNIQGVVDAVNDAAQYPRWRSKAHLGPREDGLRFWWAVRA